MDEMMEKLLFKNEESGYTYVAEFSRWAPAQPFLCQCSGDAGHAHHKASPVCYESLKRCQASILAVANIIVRWIIALLGDHSMLCCSWSCMHCLLASHCKACSGKRSPSASILREPAHNARTTHNTALLPGLCAGSGCGVISACAHL